MNTPSARSTEELRQAFAADGFEVILEVQRNGYRGLLAESRTAFNANTTEKKRAYYVEGDPFTLGWLMGRMAESHVAVMTERYLPNLVPALIAKDHVPDAGRYQWLADLFVELLKKFDDGAMKDYPPYLVEELRGIAAGCREANAETPVDFETLWTLNVGFDYLANIMWAPDKWLASLGVERKELKSPVACNAFSAWGQATANGDHLFGRDFMFPAADAFQFAAALVVYNPADTEEGPAQPFVSMTAPGIVGTIAALNQRKIAAGVHIAIAANGNPDRPGFNSLCLVRHAIQHATSAEQAVERIIDAQRGTPWMYVVSDGANNRSVTVEAGARTEDFDPYDYPPKKLRKLLPSPQQLALDPVQVRQGAVARWNDYQVPTFFMTFNPKLFAREKLPWQVDIFHTHGTPGANIDGPQMPKSYYFTEDLTPQPDLQVTCNSFVTPTMRLCSMHPVTAWVVKTDWNQLQWRYDALCWLVNDAYGSLTRESARAIIDFLAPNGIYPQYYWWGGVEPEDWRKQRIDGSVTLFDCTNLWLTSHWGNYGDEWVQLNLRAYLPPS